MDPKKLGDKLTDTFGDNLVGVAKTATIIAGLTLFFRSKLLKKMLLLLLVVAGIAVYAIWFAPGRPDPEHIKFLKDLGLTVSYDSTGVTISDVGPEVKPKSGTPQKNDFIEKVNGTVVRSVADVVFNSQQPSTTVQLTVRAGGPTGRPRNVVLELPGDIDSSAMVGVTGKFLTWIPGVIVTNVVSGSPADGQLLNDDVIKEVVPADKVKGVFDVEFALNNASPITLVVLRGGSDINRSLALSSPPPPLGTTYTITVHNQTASRVAYVWDETDTDRTLWSEIGQVAVGAPPQDFIVPSGTKIVVYPTRALTDWRRRGAKVTASADMSVYFDGDIQP